MSDAYARPSSFVQPFFVDAEYVWLDCTLRGYEGFRVEVRMNLTNRERKRLKVALNEIDENRRQIKEYATAALDPLSDALAAAKTEDDPLAVDKVAGDIHDLFQATAAKHEANNERMGELIAPYVRGWNVQEPGTDGAYHDAPPPMIAGPEAFDAIDDVMLGWIFNSVLEAYKGGKGLSGSLKKLGESPEPITESSERTSSDETSNNPNGSIPTSPETSPTPSPSTSAD